MLSDDPFVPDEGQFEINFAAASEHRDATVITAPILDLNYGLIKDVQITFATGYISTQDQKGWDAFELAFKYNFYSNDFFAIAINPKYISYPVETIFNEGSIYELSVPMSLQLSEDWSWIISLAYIYPNGHDDHLELGSYLQYHYHTQNFYAEVFTEGSKSYDDLFTLVNLGYLYQFQENLAFMLSVGREIRAQEKKATIAYGGLQLLF